MHSLSVHTDNLPLDFWHYSYGCLTKNIPQSPGGGIAEKKFGSKRGIGYYPFGSLMPERQYAGTEYRYGFQSQEIDDEWLGEGNAVSYKYRVTDSRLGRFFSVDPLSAEYPWNSSYAFAENKVITYEELEGLETPARPAVRGGPMRRSRPRVRVPQAELVRERSQAREDALRETGRVPEGDVLSRGGRVIRFSRGKGRTMLEDWERAQEEYVEIPYPHYSTARAPYARIPKRSFTNAAEYLDKLRILNLRISSNPDDYSDAELVELEQNSMANPGLLQSHHWGVLAQAQKRLATLNGSSPNLGEVPGKTEDLKKSTTAFIQGTGINAKKVVAEIPNGYAPYASNGKAKVFSNGNKYISPDLDGHKGGIWKMANKEKNLWRKETRDGTYNEDLSERVDD